MCKKLCLLLTLMTIVTAVGGCATKPLSDDDMDTYEKIHHYYNNMERYSADVTFTCYSNKTVHTYRAHQKAQGLHRFFYTVKPEKGDITVTTVCNDGNVSTATEGFDYTVTLPARETLQLLFINSFMKLYYGSETTSLSVFGAEKRNVTVLETELPQDQAYAKKAVLAIDNKTLAPLTLSLYDEDGKELLSAAYENFRYNDKSVTDSCFQSVGN